MAILRTDSIQDLSTYYSDIDGISTRTASTTNTTSTRTSSTSGITLTRTTNEPISLSDRPLDPISISSSGPVPIGDFPTPTGDDVDIFDENGDPIGDNLLVPEGRLIVTVKSNPSGGEIVILNQDTGQITPRQYSYDYKELLQAKGFRVKKNGFTSNTFYKIGAKVLNDNRTGIGRIIYTILKTTPEGSITQTILADGPTSVVELDFPLQPEEDVPTPIDITTDDGIYNVTFDVDSTERNAIRYVTSDGQEGFLNDTQDKPTISIEKVSGVAWIDLKKVGITDETHNVKYTITSDNTSVENTYTTDIRRILTADNTFIFVEVDKIVQTPVTGVSPTIGVENDNLEYNYASDDSVDIVYVTSNADKISYSIGNIIREAPANGRITLRKSDFVNGLGQYTAVLQPISNQNGSGAVKRVNINVVSRQYLPGPDITKINYPYNIKGADFKGFNEDFKISWQSVNTNYIEVYVSKRDKEYSLAKVAGAGALTLNVGEVLKKAKKSFNDSTDVVTFDLILIPFNTEGNSVVSGKEEKITIVFDKSDIRLRRNQVLYDIRTAFERNFNRDIFKQQASRFLTHLIHFGGADNKLVSTWGIDTETFSVYETNQETSQRRRVEYNPALVLKLYEPLPGRYQPNQQLWISKAQTLPIIEQIVLTDDEVDSCIQLTPNFDLEISDDIGFQILDDLVASGSTTSTELIQQYIGDNEFSLSKLDLEFISGSEYAWENFVKYSSAEERVENFVYKVQLIEFYSSSLSNLNEALTFETGGLSVQNEITRTTEKINNVQRGFDAFEYHLYTQSGSLNYPRTGPSGSVLPSSDSEVTAWYSAIKTSAQNFDVENRDKLTNNIPIHFVNDDSGQDYILFFNMIGQHFDVLWSYIKKFSKSKQLRHTNQSGITDELVYHMLESLGWDADMGVKSQVLWEYAFGKNKDGTSSSSMSGKERQQEIWRRLLNNLPYLYKYKGTRRALLAAMACYGVPSSMLTIMEYGGPVDPSSSGTTKFTFDDRTAAINFDGTSNILVPWVSGSVNALEFRVNTEVKQTHTIAKGERWELYVIPDTGSLAKVEFRITGSTPGQYHSASVGPLPLFNDVYTQINLNRTVSGSGASSTQTYELYVKEGFNERIRNEGYASASFLNSVNSWNPVSQTEFTIGEGFVGTMDEFRIWNTPLSESRIENHTLLPDAIDGNHFSSSTEDLLFRLDFEYPKDRTLDTDIINVAINQTYATTASMQGFPAAPNYPYQYTTYERVVTANVPSTGIGLSNKIRFETSTLDNYLNFGSISNATTFENADDSNKLGLFFSPTAQINLDIVRSLGQFNIDNYIGNQADVYNSTYTDLDDLRDYYFDRYTLNIYEYIQLVRYIDQSLFTTLKSLVPGRADIATGLLIEPHILERSKVEQRESTAENIGEETTITINDDLVITSENPQWNAEITASEDISLEVENPQWDGTVNAESEIELDVTTPFYNGTIVVSDEEEVIGEYRTWESTIDAKFTGSIQGEYDSNQFQSIGTDPDGITNAGFGIWAEDGVTVRTTLDNFGNRIQRRQRVYQIKEQRVVNIPENINSNDSSLGTVDVPTTFFDYRVTFLNYSQSAPTVSGDIVEVTAVDGYLPSHYRYVGDLPTGLQNSWYNGSKQTVNTTLDGSSPVQTFTTNPNQLRVNPSGRGSGEPILEVN